MTDVVAFHELDRSQVALAGGKAANLGELHRVAGVCVPAGFCVTTTAFHRAAEDATGMPADLVAAIESALDRLAGERFAVRSSATAEDLAGASFAGQYDTFLDVARADVVEHVRRCWRSLSTSRAVAYRASHDVEPGTGAMAVIVQEMVDPIAAGVLFTADPTSGNRRVAVVEAVAGLGEALVSGRARPDTYRVRDGRVDGPAGGVVDERQVRELVGLGRQIEDHFGEPQDIEWCLDASGFQVVQSRPITTLFPVPERDDDEPHVYVSVGHQQMMTDAMTPLGISMWQLVAGRPMFEAGGRIFVDVAEALSSPAGRAGVIGMLGRSDPLIGDALQTVAAREGFLPPRDDPPPPPGGPPPPIETDPAVVAELIEQQRASEAALEEELRHRSGPELLAFVREHAGRLLRSDPRSLQVVMASYDAARWLEEHLEAWLGERGAVDRLTRSVPHNVSSEMGLDLLDVADAVRPHPEAVALLRDADDDVLERLPSVSGGDDARRVLEAYLDRYGARCVGEIDIARPRWRERPRALVPMILADVDHHEPGEARRRFEQGRRDAEEAASQLLDRLRALPGGDEKAAEAGRMIDRLRTFAGYREHPKYWMMRHYWHYRHAILREAARLVEAGVLDEPDDVAFLRFEELEEAARTGHVAPGVLTCRKEAFRRYQGLTPPRVLTSEGEALAGAYRRTDVPPGALTGLGVSAGTVEGRARVVLDPADADLEPGDVLVTTHTDPSWSPLFVTAAALVTEVGGLTTHGAVVAREYGLPAVVGVERATELIEDGRRIRVDGANGVVELV